MEDKDLAVHNSTAATCTKVFRINMLGAQEPSGHTQKEGLRKIGLTPKSLENNPVLDYSSALQRLCGAFRGFASGGPVQSSRWITLICSNGT